MNEMFRQFQELFAAPLRNGLTRPKSVRGHGVKMVNMGEIFAHRRIGAVPMDRVPLSPQEAANYVLKPGDLLFARQSLVLAGAGKCSIFIGDQNPVTFESHLIRARLNPRVADPLFYFYFFNSRAGQEATQSIVEQVAAAGIRSSDLARLLVPVPPLPLQRAIAYILGSLDDKIELNQRMNETLGAIARAIFKSWFVDFDPVRAKSEGRDPPAMDAETATLFPDAFEDSPLGKMPRGWGVSRIEAIAQNVRRGVRPSDIEADTPYIALEHMPRRSIVLSDWGGTDGIASGKFQFRRGEILFGKLRPYFHKVGVAPVDGVCSTDIVVANPVSEAWFGFLLGHFSSDEFVAHADAVSTGTKMPRTNWNDMARYEVVLPPESVAAAFSSVVKEFVDLIHLNIHESRTLAAIRDALLPKLLSGKIRVEDAERLGSAV